MSNVLITILIAALVIGGCIVLLSISRLLSGRTRIQGGMCGKDPTKKKESCDDKNDDDSCGLCGR